ncbi:fatty acid synthase-like [Uranotaenia lowii]|uniref:fatty acid synthase-like n=1 Tax=Uranotaenia lowii TaxID=190385 RepID=UPI00247B2848|nr:fatty acid synthase-like [Uranotaenia lowii]
MPSEKRNMAAVGERVVISGISGRFPKSDNVAEFAKNLYAKRDLVDDLETRWKHVMPDMPRRTGKISKLNKFDGEFFGFDRRRRDTMDPQQRMLIEHAYEAVLDSGINPESIRGSRTGVYCGICFSETEVRMYYRSRPPKGLGILGCAKSQCANGVSYALDLRGPTHVIDTACSSSMYALDVAYKSIMNGECDAAIVMGTNLTLHPFITYQFALLGVLSKDGFCKPFDKDASGYSRAEAVCAVYLQKAKDAKRVYAQVVHSKTNCDGFKAEGITYPSGVVQQRLLQEFYDEVGISPTAVDYVEAHSTGTFVGDPEECDALDKIYCTGRKRALPVGSVKSSIGHTEASAGVCSIAKCVIAMENNMIPPNINFTESRPTIPSLVEGRLVVVHEAIPLAGPLVGINSFGFGGANSHALLCRNMLEKKNHGLPEDDLPRLVIWSGRTKEAVEVILNDVSQRPLDAEFIALLYNVQQEHTPGHRYRGFGIYSKNDSQPAILHNKAIDRILLEPLPLLVIFGGVNVFWRQELTALRQFPKIEKVFQECDSHLRSYKFDLHKQPTVKEQVLYDMVGTTVLQLATVEILRSIGVEFDLYGGYSVGQFTCAYIDGCLSLEQVVKLAFWHGLVYAELDTIYEMSALVKVSSKLDRTLLPPMPMNEKLTFGIISGHEKFINLQIQQLRSSQSIVEKLPFVSLRCESAKSASLVNRLRQTVNTVFSRNLNPSSKWINSKFGSNPSVLHTPTIHMPQSIANLLDEIPKHVVVLMGNGSDSLENVLNVLNRKPLNIPGGSRSSDPVQNFLTQVGHLHMVSKTKSIARLYPEVKFPVSRGTPMIAPLHRWDHRETAHVVQYNWDETSKSSIASYKISLGIRDFAYIDGHCIDGRVLFPATGYLLLVWDLLAYMAHRELNGLPVEFTDVQFLRATTITKQQTVNLCVLMQIVSGFFEVLEGDTVVVTGYAKPLVETTNVPVIEENERPSVVLPTKDFYKELRLRGYHYGGLFRSVLEARSDSSSAKIQWKGHWVPFLDCLLQLGIIGIDTRALMVPTAIDKISIDPKLHFAVMESMEDGCEYFTARCNTHLNVTVCGGVVISNPQVNTIARRSPPGVPVLEGYQFVPYHSEAVVSEKEAIRMCVQLALENVMSLNITVAEIHNPSLSVILPAFREAVADLPLVRTKLTLLSSQQIELDSITVEAKHFSETTELLFLVTDNVLTDEDLKQSIPKCLLPNGYILMRKAPGFDWRSVKVPDQFVHVATFHVDTNECLILLQRISKTLSDTPTVIKVDSNNLSWLPELKQAVKLRPVVLYSQNDQKSGVIGLVNCIRKEPKLQGVRCVFLDDPTLPAFDLSKPFYAKQLGLGLAINVFRDGHWGSYRHALLPPAMRTKSVKHHCYANCFNKGDLSSMMWFDGKWNEPGGDSNICTVSVCSLNFRDVMIATGRISSDAMNMDRLNLECELGFEFAGIAEDGRRIMGIVDTGALATKVKYDPELIWQVPDSWTLEEACTAPIVYGTVLMAFDMCSNIRKGKSILIHAGSGGVGLAAINLAMYHGLEVFTTVSTAEKKNYLLNLFPDLDPEKIGCSRDTSFEQMVKIQTKGRGVDYVLNSLSEEKLLASVRCLGYGGHFLEIGKYDMAKNTKLSMLLFQKGITFTSVMLDLMFKQGSLRRTDLHAKLTKALAAGIIKPLRTTVFDACDLEKAFRFLASGKHMGKVLLKVRKNETDLETIPIPYFPRVHCHSEAVSIIVGGLGGFGLELADWLIMRGCRKLVLSSSRGLSKAYQTYRIETWKRYGVEIKICTADITTDQGCKDLILEAKKLGSVSMIYNLAVRLRDSILENQTEETFADSLGPKAKATEFLDKWSRELCPELKQFVVFSSVSCGRGNAGQSNYGMSNSVMERIVERRHAEGLPAKAIQWGAVGDVGLVADMAEDKIDMEIGGTLQQRITSCLREMDYLLTSEYPLVASMVVAEKRLGTSKNAIEAVMNIMNIRDLKSISLESTLADIGMDSLMAVEIKQVLERDFDLVLSPQELRVLSFAKLTKLDEEKKAMSNDNQDENTKIGIQMLFRNLGNEENSEKTILHLESAGGNGNPILIIPGAEGVAGNVWNEIAKGIHAPVAILQLMSTIASNTVPEIVDCVIDELYSEFFGKHKTYSIVGYSFGSIIAIEIVKRLQAKGMQGQLLLIDGSPKFLKELSVKSLNENPTDEDIQKRLLAVVISIVFPNITMEKVVSIMNAPSFEGQIEKIIELSHDQTGYSANYVRQMTTALYKRVKITLTNTLDEDQPLDVPITLVRPTEVSYADADDDYGLSSYTTGEIDIRTIEGSHVTMLENPILVNLINTFNTEVL